MAEFLTHCPGTGGSIKEDPADFLVEELPLYEPCGEGEHLYLQVEKSGLTTFDLLARLAKGLGVRERDLGYAGLKDAKATTRQQISVPGVTPEQVDALNIPGVKFLSARYHRNKLRPGHLAGNRFRIRLRGVGANALDHALDTLHALENLGVPNFFGEQRYGVLNNSHRIGHAILRQDFQLAVREILGDPEEIDNPRWRQAALSFRAGDLAAALDSMPPRFRNERLLLHAVQEGRDLGRTVLNLPRKLLRLFLSAYQSELFDRLVSMRLASIETLWPGDLAFKHDNGACFLVTDPAAEQPRADRLEISASAPLFGRKVRLAEGQAGILEESLLQKEGLRLEAFDLSGGLAMEGERRAIRVPLSEVSCEQLGDDLLLGFSLPKGSYATSVLREVIKRSP